VGRKTFCSIIRSSHPKKSHGRDLRSVTDPPTKRCITNDKYMTLNRRRNWKVAQNISKANCKLWAYSLSACSSDFVDLAPLVNLRIVCCNYADHGAPAPKSRTPLLLLLLLHSKRKPISDQLQPPLHCGIFFQIVAVRPCAISDLGL